MKLVKDELESAAMWKFIRGSRLLGSELLLAEVPRALRSASLEDPTFNLTRHLIEAEILPDSIGLHSIDRLALTHAGRIPKPGLRSLDAIHVIAALELRPIRAFVTYDKRQAAAAQEVGLRTLSPGRPPIR